MKGFNNSKNNNAIILSYPVHVGSSVGFWNQSQQ